MTGVSVPVRPKRIYYVIIVVRGRRISWFTVSKHLRYLWLEFERALKELNQDQITYVHCT